MKDPEIKLVNYEAGAVEAGTGDVFHVEVEGFGPVYIERWITRHGSGVDFYDEKTGHPIETKLFAHLERWYGDDDEGMADTIFEYLSGNWLSEVSDRYEKSLDSEGYVEMAKRAKAHAEATPFSPPGLSRGAVGQEVFILDDEGH
jgi:hypothetical protein